MREHTSSSLHITRLEGCIKFCFIYCYKGIQYYSKYIILIACVTVAMQIEFNTLDKHYIRKNLKCQFIFPIYPSLLEVRLFF